MSTDEQVPVGRPGAGSGWDGLDRPTRQLAAYLAALGGLLLVWWAFSNLVVPELLRLTHEGRDLPLLSHLMAGRETTPLEAYLERWAEFSGGITLLLGVFGLLSLTFALTLPGVVKRLEASQPVRPLTNRTVGALWTGGLLLVVLVVAILSHVAPVAYVYSITEDYWIEHATFVAFMLAGGFFLWAAVTNPGYRRLGPLGFALAAFFVGMEEVSWGQRIVGIPTPELLEAYNYQGELTLHNIWFPRHVVVGSVVVLFGVAVPPLARRWAALGSLLQRLAVPLPRPHLRPVFVVAGALLAYAAYSPSYLKIDEVGEFALGVAVLLLGLELAMKAGTGRPPGARATLASGAGALTAVVVTTGILVHVAPYPDSLRWRLNDFAAQRFPDAEMYDQADILFRYMEENPELQASSTHVEHARLLLGIGHQERARRALRRALEAQEARLALYPAALPDVRRVQAEAHLLLEQPAQAEEALQEALAADRAALERTDDEAERAEIHWSLALSAELYGDEDAALHHATTACQLAEDRVLRRRIEHWGEETWGLESDVSPCEEAGGPV